MLYYLFRSMFRGLFRLFYRFEVLGKENIPDQGAVLVCSNHIHWFDPPLVGSSLERKVSFMAKAELFKIPVLSYLIREFGAFPVKRGASDKQALRSALKILSDGHMLGIFPEGTRSKTGELGKAFSGVGLFALKENPVVIPVAIIGNYTLFKKMKVVIGKPVELQDLRDEKVSSESTKEATDRIMANIQQLLNEHRS